MNKKITAFTLVIISLTGILYISYMSQNNSIKLSKEDSTQKEIQQIKKDLALAIKDNNRKKVKELEEQIIAYMPKGYRALHKMAKIMDKKIHFYGKVIDQNNVPVANAIIKYSALGLYNLTESDRGSVKTGENGIFEIKSHGYMLSVYAPEHPELSDVLFNPKYEGNEPRRVLVFNFDDPDKQADWKRYSKRNPLFISVWRPVKFESLVNGRGNRSVTSNGEVHTFVNSKYVPGSKYRGILMKKGLNDKGYITFSCTRDPQDDARPGSTGSWAVVMEPVNGGILTTDDLYLNQAPRTGYQPSIVIDMPKDSVDYKRILHRQKYYFTAQNNEVYGSLVITFEPFAKKSRCLFAIEYKINVNASRNLAMKTTH